MTETLGYQKYGVGAGDYRALVGAQLGHEFADSPASPAHFLCHLDIRTRPLAGSAATLAHSVGRDFTGKPMCVRCCGD